MAGTDFSHLTDEELLNGIKALNIPDYIRMKSYGVDVRETLAQMTEMLMQLAYNQGMDPQQAQDFVYRINNKINKGEVSMSDLTQEVKLALTGGAVAVVGENAVGTENIVDGAVTPSKFSKEGHRINHFDKDDLALGQIWGGWVGVKPTLNNSNDYTSPSTPINVSGGDVVRFTHATFASYFLGVNEEGFVVQQGESVGSTPTDTSIVVQNDVVKFYTSAPSAYINEAMITVNEPIPNEYYGYDEFAQHNVSWLLVDNNNIDVRAIESRNVAANAITAEKIDGSIITKTIKYSDLENENGKTWTSNLDTKPTLVTSNDFTSPKSPISVSEGDIVKFSHAAFNTYFIGVDQNGITKQTVTNLGAGPVEAEVKVDSGIVAFYTNIRTSILDEATINIHSSRKDIDWLSVTRGNLNNLLSDKKWVAFGDSLTEVNHRTTTNYHKYIAEDTGIEVVNMGVSGTGYARRANEGKAFYQRVSSVPIDADVITFFGSGNDLGAGLPLGDISDTGTDTMAGSINTTLTNLYAVNPIFKVGIITPTPWNDYKPGSENAMTEYVDLLIAIANNWGIPVLDLYRTSGLRPWDTDYKALMYSRDDGNGVHPDENGHKFFYPQVREFIKTLI